MKTFRNYINNKVICFINLVLVSVVCVSCNQNIDGNPKHTGVKWIKVPGGTFTMGSPQGIGEFNEHPAHEVTVKTVEFMEAEVTVGQYQQCVDEKICWKTLKPDNEHYCNYGKKERHKHPINCIDWHQANSFCAWFDARLPSEAEWEFAARSRGKDYAYPWGNEPAPNCDYTVIDTKEGIGCGAWSTWDVCSKRKGDTEQGICDMAGNVIEWVNDWYYLKYQPKPGTPVPDITNFKNGEVGPNRVMRGGGIGSDEDYRARNRIYHATNFQYGGLGIRCVRDVKS